MSHYCAPHFGSRGRVIKLKRYALTKMTRTTTTFVLEFSRLGLWRLELLRILLQTPKVSISFVRRMRAGKTVGECIASHGLTDLRFVDPPAD